MSRLRIRSARAPFDDAALAPRAARLLGLAEAMGLLPGEDTITVLDRPTMERALAAMSEAGIGTQQRLALRSRARESATGLADVLDGLIDALVASPLPERELGVLVELLGIDEVAALVGAATSSVRRYLSGERAVPPVVAARAHVVAMVAGDLGGSYNDAGVRRWFTRPRHQL